MNIQSVLKQALILLLLFSSVMPRIMAQTDDQKALWEAIENDDLKAVKGLIKKGVTMNEVILQKDPAYTFYISREIYLAQVGEKGEPRYVYMTPLQFASLKNRLKIAKYMLKKGANIDAGDSQGKVALMYALWQPGGEELALYFLKKGANYVARDQIGNTALHYAALGGNPQGIHMTYGGGINVNDRNQEGITPFFAACVKANTAILQQLASMDAEVKAEDSVGMNALHYAAANGDLEGLKWLVAQGVDINAVAENGFSPLDIAELANNKANANYLKGLGARYHLWRYDELLAATQQGATSEVGDLLAAGVNPNCRSKDYPAHIAARKGDIPTLERLLKGGANPDLTNAAGLTPFEEAIKAGHAGCAITLLENGSATQDVWLPEVLEAWANDPVKSSWEELINRFLPKVTDKNQMGGSQKLTALQYAAWICSPEVVQALLNSGASANTVDEKGWTALHWNSVAKGEMVTPSKRLAVAEMLVKAGAGISAETEKPRKLQEGNRTALFFPPHSTPLDVLDNALMPIPELEAFLLQKGSPRMLSAGDYLAVGNEHLEAKDYVLAMRDYSRAITANPNLAEGYIGRAKAMLAKRLFTEAQRDLAIAVKKVPQNAEAWYLLSSAQFELKANKDAFNSAKTAVGLDPELVDAYWYKAEAALALGDKLEGCNSFVDGANKGSDRCRKSYDIHCRK